MYAQLPARDRTSLQAVKDALCSVFAPDAIGAYEEFVARRLKPGEAVDIFLADLRRLSSLFGGVSERTLVCSFISGLPFHAREAVSGGCRVQDLTVDSVLKFMDQRRATGRTRSRLSPVIRDLHHPHSNP